MLTHWCTWLSGLCACWPGGDDWNILNTLVNRSVGTTVTIVWVQHNTQASAGLSNSRIRKIWIPNIWIHQFRLAKIWIEEFRLPKIWIQQFSLPNFWIQQFRLPNNEIQKFLTSKQFESQKFRLPDF